MTVLYLIHIVFTMIQYLFMGRVYLYLSLRAVLTVTIRKRSDHMPPKKPLHSIVLRTPPTVLSSVKLPLRQMNLKVILTFRSRRRNLIVHRNFILFHFLNHTGLANFENRRSLSCTSCGTVCLSN